MTKTIVGLFDDFGAARAAVDELMQNGVRESEISLVRQDKDDGAGRADGTHEDGEGGTHAAAAAATGAGTGALVGGAAGLIASLAGIAIPGFGPVLAAGWLAATLAGAGVGAVAGGLIGALVGAGVPEQEARIYEEGIRRGKTLVTVRAADDDAERVALVLDGHGALDIDRTAEDFERSGWRRAEESTVQADAGSRSKKAQGISAQGEVRMPVVEEELQVEKRKVERGRVRVYSHTSERPIEKHVTLREEHVQVERRPVGEELRDASLLETEDQVVEVEETAEEAVVAKRARVVEEVIVRKEAREHEEVIRDVVRRKDVEVEQLEPGMAAAGRAPRFDEYDAEFHKHYNQALGNRGMTYEQCAPAYRLGAELTQDERMRARDWTQVEPEARRRWEEQHPGTWNKVSDAARYSWDRLTGHA